MDPDVRDGLTILSEGADGLSDVGFGCDVGLGSYDVVGEWWLRWMALRWMASMDGVGSFRQRALTWKSFCVPVVRVNRTVVACFASEQFEG